MNRTNASTRPAKVGALFLVFLALTLLTAAVLNRMYAKWVTEPTVVNAEQNQQTLMRMVGLHDPVMHRLDARFADADADLVADAPSDPAKQVDPEKIVFCYIADDDAETSRAAWKPFIDHLSKATGKPVEYSMFTSIKEQLRALRDGTLHVTGLNTGNVPVAVNECGFVPVCVLPTNDGTGLSRMRLIVPGDSAIHSLPDLKDHELTLTSPGSNSGYKAALVLLKSDFGLFPGRDFTIRYSGGHTQSIDGIAAKQFQAAAVSDDMLGRALANGQIKAEQYRSIYESEKFPTAGLGYVYNLKPALAAKVREALMTFDWKATPLVERLGSAGGTKFVEANYKNDWALIRRIDDESGQVHDIDAPGSNSGADTESVGAKPAAPSSQPATAPVGGAP